MKRITPQHRAVTNYRKRLTERGMARFEVLAPGSDRELIRSLAKRLAGDDSSTERIRTAVRRCLSPHGPDGLPVKKGGIVAALRRSPMVGADLDLRRLAVADREVDL